MTRNFCFGLPSESYKRDYAMLLQAQKNTLNQVEAGAKAKALDLFCRKQMGKASELFVHSLGHGVGLEIHEAPTLSARSKDVLQTNEVVTVEPGIYRPNEYGIRIEDSLIVGTDGAEILTKTTKELLSFDEDGSVKVLVA
jgi:Xaa-Pro aminopeptidase